MYRNYCLVPKILVSYGCFILYDGSSHDGCNNADLMVLLSVSREGPCDRAMPCRAGGSQPRRNGGSSGEIDC